jgi:hypothetical protein
MIFVLQIKGTGILAFDADSLEDAQAVADDVEEREDLTELTSNGAPLWNGKDAISVRVATAAEAALFEEQRDEDWNEEPHTDREDFAVYLVPLDEPDED